MRLTRGSLLGSLAALGFWGLGFRGELQVAEEALEARGFARVDDEAVERPVEVFCQVAGMEGLLWPSQRSLMGRLRASRPTVPLRAGARG